MHRNLSFFKKTVGEFSGDCRKPSESAENLGNIILDLFNENIFGKIISQSSEYFRFGHKINCLLTGLLVPYREIPRHSFSLWTIQA